MYIDFDIVIALLIFFLVCYFLFGYFALRSGDSFLWFACAFSLCGVLISIMLFSILVLYPGALEYGGVICPG